MQLESPSGGLLLSSQIADYETLKGAILASFNPTIVRTDLLWLGERSKSSGS
jgi:hypothetical protein